ncbi:hypothetical protein LSTR_LSTR009418 [Laodelphax striatellus]|uniref:Uncharacterized protein n=1 Tax=Laodelphax striatellus TaxID=195883 RepID=A0A482WPG1_LAOST|nr:hypothetical protein LSTR_LSTR009418 [Laodelphax striatellus]
MPLHFGIKQISTCGGGWPSGIQLLSLLTKNRTLFSLQQALCMCSPQVIHVPTDIQESGVKAYATVLSLETPLIEKKAIAEKTTEVTSKHLEIVYPKIEEAEIVFNCLRVDREPPRSQVTKQLSLDGRKLQM